MNEIIQQMLNDAASNGPININASAQNPDVLRDMVARAALDRRFIKRLEKERRR